MPLAVCVAGCSSSSSERTRAAADSASQTADVRLMTLDPGHFHAALVQKYDYPQVDSVVHVYAPEGEDLQMHLARIEQFNTRAEDPTHWVEKVYTGPDFLEQMLKQKPGNVVVLSGNNAKKTDYINAAVNEGLNVLADKPMVIQPADYPRLLDAFRKADERGVLIYDIMTERHEISTMLQKELAGFPEVFGELVKGTPQEPAISKESVHHFYKMVAGKPLIRPAWFFDADQQGAGIVDVSTHLVDLILWECFPEQGIDTSEVQVLSARRWATELSPRQFETATGVATFPDFLQPHVNESGSLSTHANGEFVFTVRGVHGKVSVIWNFQAPEGAADTHYSIMRGTKANLVIRQDQPQNYQPTLYVEPVAGQDRAAIGAALQQALARIGQQYPGVAMAETPEGWEVKIPDEFKVGHEAHFSQVTEDFLQYLADGKIPAWEKQNMITKYYLTTQAYTRSR
ncbi:Predicted dehydrogenase [Catalinimonas alkaloidigena]|uniref:Predicted dehydrogenase n=2 Tax=Catalinimonas alkaloidigena TaxID=1075417 RepID=A0A1G9K0Y1_9BACT|nr:Predicted dehydrogenase [Catalinimonas alkaloidigena]